MTNKEAIDIIDSVIVDVKKWISIDQYIAHGKIKDTHVFERIEKNTKYIQALRYAQSKLNSEG